MKKSNNMPAIFNESGLTLPGDKAVAYITPTGKQVIKTEKTRGNKIAKYSATRYPSTGTIHVTKTIKTK